MRLTEFQLNTIAQLKEAMENGKRDIILKSPTGSGKTYKSKDEIMAIKNTNERQKAIAENHEMFGF